MADEREGPRKQRLLLGRLAIARRLITEAQLNECLAVQGASPRPLKLGEVLVAKGYLTHEQVENLLQIQSSRFAAKGPGLKALAFGFVRCEEIAGYAIERELSATEESAVFEVSCGPERSVLKSLAEGLTTRRGEPWRQAARALGMAPDRPSSVAATFAEGEIAARAYVISEWLEGRTLSDELARGPITIDQALRMSGSLASAITFAHGRGIGHYNINPSHIALRSDGSPVLRDFGLAPRQSLDEAEPLGPTLAPEQIAAAGAPGPRADLYGLGATLYIMLCGSAPFRGTGVALRAAILGARLVPPRHLNPAIPKPLEAICLRALARADHERYASAESFAADLNRFQRGEPVEARSGTRRIFSWMLDRFRGLPPR